MKSLWYSLLFAGLACAACSSNEAPGPAAFDVTPHAIINGQDVPPFQYASILYFLYRHLDGTDGICTGTLISDTAILTAAHCVVECGTLAPLTLRYAMITPTKFQYDESGPLPILKATVHPDYECEPAESGAGATTLEHDIAIVELKAPVPRSRARPALLASASQSKIFAQFIAKSSRDITTVGYGQTDANDSMSTGKKRMTTLSAIAYCSQTTQTESEFCTGKWPRSVLVMECGDSCISFGDSGGPDLVDFGGIDYVMAVHSTMPSKDGKTYVMSSLVDDARDFIMANVKNLESLEPENCTNGDDDNGNGLVDCLDSMCEFAEGCGIENCDNVEDDNGNNLVDCDDPVCEDAIWCQPEECTNGVDDNDDDEVDCDDAQCKDHAACKSDEPPNEPDPPVQPEPSTKPDAPETPGGPSGSAARPGYDDGRESGCAAMPQAPSNVPPAAAIALIVACGAILRRRRQCAHLERGRE